MKSALLDLLAIAALSVSLSGCATHSMNQKLATVKAEARVGSNIDDAIKRLRAQGFSVGDKYLPSVAEDYYIAVVGFRKSIPFESVFHDTTGISIGQNWNGPSGAAIFADLKGRITRVE